VAALDFEQLVEVFYMPLYRFALSLSREPSDAADLTQQTFLLWASKGHQLRDGSKVKTWLFTSLYREFLRGERKRCRDLEFGSETQAADVQSLPVAANQLDGDAVRLGARAGDAGGDAEGKGVGDFLSRMKRRFSMHPSNVSPSSRFSQFAPAGDLSKVETKQ